MHCVITNDIRARTRNFQRLSCERALSVDDWEEGNSACSFARWIASDSGETEPFFPLKIVGSTQRLVTRVKNGNVDGKGKGS